MTARFLLRMPTSLYEQLKAQAEQERRSINEQINFIVERYLARDEWELEHGRLANRSPGEAGEGV